MFDAIASPYLVPFEASFRVRDAPTAPPKKAISGKRLKQRFEEQIERLDEQQRRLYAADSHAVLLVFQAMDAGGKDGTIRAVMSGVNPAGCQVFAFKKPSENELDHDFLWRTAKSLPERGRIGIFNRSYYEEVLVVRVHSELLDFQKLPDRPGLDELWRQRYESIRDHERHLARSGTVILKFWLNVSFEEQRRRFLERIDAPHKNWKFSEADCREREHWDAYMEAYEHALKETSRPWAPWYAIPADNKKFMRLTVAELIVDSLDSLNLEYPKVGRKERERLAVMRDLLAE